MICLKEKSGPFYFTNHITPSLNFLQFIVLKFINYVTFLQFTDKIFYRVQDPIFVPKLGHKLDNCTQIGPQT